MELGMVGLGKMGANMTTRLMRAGHRLLVHDRSSDAMKSAESQGAMASGSLQELVGSLRAPRAVWVMVPAGGPTEMVVEEEPIDIVEARPRQVPFVADVRKLLHKKEQQVGLGFIARRKVDMPSL